MEKSNVQAPQGITYVGKDAYEYQLFPEEYFSGADVSIYFGDVWVDEITGLQFSLLEQVRPIFGYASRTWDFVSRGNRMVVGSFRIAFKEAGYLNSILSHIGMLEESGNVAPKLAYYMNGNNDAPFWYGSCQERIEDILDRYHVEDGAIPENPRDPNRAAAQGFRIMAVDRPTTDLKYGDKDSTTGGWITKLQQAIKKQYPDFCKGSITTTDWPTLQVGSKGAYVKKLQQRLKEYWCDPGATDGDFGQRTKDAVLSFQRRAKLNPDGVVGKTTRYLLSQGFAIDGDFGAVTRLSVMMIQSQEKLTVDGIVGSSTKKLLWPDIAGSPSAPTTQKITICPPEVLVTNGKSYTWARLMAEKVGHAGDVTYDQATNKVTIAGKVFTCAKYDISAGKSYVYIREVGEAFGFIVNPNAATGCVELTKSTGSTDTGNLGTPTTGGIGGGSSQRKDSNLASEPRLTELEKEIWGRSFNPHAEEYNKRTPYFYRGEYPSKLLQKGFDIYLVYGPLAQFAINKKEQYTDKGINGNAQLGTVANFNTTVKAIRKIQCKSTGQVLDASGNPVEEIYEFIAQDLD